MAHGWLFVSVAVYHDGMNLVKTRLRRLRRYLLVQGTLTPLGDFWHHPCRLEGGTTRQ
jgi:hypothetical protein